MWNNTSLRIGWTIPLKVDIFYVIYILVYNVQQTFNKIVSKGRDGKLLSQLVGHVFERGHLLSRVHLNAISISEKNVTLKQGSINCYENHIFPPY
jgi:hypothetical protein